MSIEDDFKAVLDANADRIHEYLAEAAQFLDKAIELSEKLGVPFESSISFISQTYTPVSCEIKWPGLDRASLANDDIYFNEYGDYGWQHSAVC